MKHLALALLLAAGAASAEEKRPIPTEMYELKKRNLGDLLRRNGVEDPSLFAEYVDLISASRRLSREEIHRLNQLGPMTNPLAVKGKDVYDTAVEWQREILDYERHYNDWMERQMSPHRMQETRLDARAPGTAAARVKGLAPGTFGAAELGKIGRLAPSQEAARVQSAPPATQGSSAKISIPAISAEQSQRALALIAAGTAALALTRSPAAAAAVRSFAVPVTAEEDPVAFKAAHGLPMTPKERAEAWARGLAQNQ